MVCNLCKKNPAVIYLEQPGSPKPRRLCLCESCAISRGIITKPQIPDQKKINDLMDELDRAEKANQADQKILCPICSQSLYDLKSTHTVGCQYCYETFKNDIEEISGLDIDIAAPDTQKKQRTKKRSAKKLALPSPAGENDLNITPKVPTEKKHTKKPKTFDDASDLQTLQNALDKAVRLENYEEAAKLRDKINEFKKSMTPAKIPNDIDMPTGIVDDDSLPF